MFRGEPFWVHCWNKVRLKAITNEEIENVAIMAALGSNPGAFGGTYDCLRDRLC